MSADDGVRVPPSGSERPDGMAHMADSGRAGQRDGGSASERSPVNPMVPVADGAPRSGGRPGDALSRRPAVPPSPTRGKRLHASIGRVRALLRKEMRQTLRDPKTKRLVFAAPIIQLLMFGYAVTTDVRNVKTIVVDHDRTYASRTLQDRVQAGGYFQVVDRSDRSGDITHALDDGRATIGIEIPEGFERDLTAGRGAHVQVLVDGTNSNTGTVAQGYLGRIVQQFGLDYARSRGTALTGGVDVRARAWFNPGLESRVYNVPAVVGVLLSLMCFLLTALAVVRERELGTLEQLMVSPLTATELILGKVAPVIIIGFIDLALVTTVALLWFGVPFVGSALVLVAAAFLYILAAIGVGLFISTVSRTQQEAFMTMFLVMFPMIFLSGFIYPVRSMPVFFQYLTLLNPLRHFIEIVRGVFLKGAGFVDLWPQFGAVAAAAVVVLALSVFRFRAAAGRG